MRKFALPRNGRAHRRGFTLLELILVVSLIGILARIALPNFVGSKDKAYLDAVQSDLRNIMIEQENFYADNGVYAHGTAEDGRGTSTSLLQDGTTGPILNYATSDDVTVVVTPDATDPLRGYAATGNHALLDSSITCSFTVARGASAKIICVEPA